MKKHAALSVIQVTKLPVSVTAWATADNDRLVQVISTTQSRQRIAASVLTANISPFCWLWFLGFYSVSLLGISGLMMGLHWLLDVI